MRLCVVCAHTRVHLAWGVLGKGRPQFFHLKANSNQKAQPRRIPSSSFPTAAAVKYFYNHLSQIMLRQPAIRGKKS